MKLLYILVTAPNLIFQHSVLLILLCWTTFLHLSIQQSTEDLSFRECQQKRYPSVCQPNNDEHLQNGKSNVESFPGHWPPSFCKVSNVYFDSAARSFFVGLENLTSLDTCYGVTNIWNFSTKNRTSINHPEKDEKRLADSSNQSSNNNNNNDKGKVFHCDQIFEAGYVFPIYYYHGSNYFHLHYDTAIPLYWSLHHNKQQNEEKDANNIVLMPMVEVKRGEGTEWMTDAFLNESSYWVEILKVVAEPYRLLPLDSRLWAMQKTMCFKDIYFGTPKVNMADPELINGFVTYIKTRLGITNNSNLEPVKPLVGLIHRSGRRKIINEEKLISALKPKINVETVEFATMSFQEQVKAVQKYSILAGINGAGLMNAIYLPKRSVAIQMIPYKAQLNYEEYRTVLQSRGFYLEWHNTHEDMNKINPDDVYSTITDTTVDVKEFLETINRAFIMLLNSQYKKIPSNVKWKM